MELIILIVIGVTFGLGVLIYAQKQKSQKITPQNLQYIRSHWQKINQIKNDNPTKAILDADKLLDYTLKLHGYTGTLGEKLKKSEKIFSNINNVWKAHKLRNQIAHQLIDISNTQTETALRYFKQALQDLEVSL